MATKRISLDNGNRWQTADDVDGAELDRLWDALVPTMDDEARELAHSDSGATNNRDFLRYYLAHAPHDLCIG